MKFLKSTLAIVALFAIASVNAKQSVRQGQSSSTTANTLIKKEVPVSTTEENLPKKEEKLPKKMTESGMDEAQRKTNMLYGCINTILRKRSASDDINSLYHILMSTRYDFDKIKIIFDEIIIDVNKCSESQKAVESVLIHALEKNYFGNLNATQQKQIIDYIKESFASM